MSYRKINLTAAVKIALAVNAGAVMGGMPLLAAAEADTIEEMLLFLAISEIIVQLEMLILRLKSQENI